MNKMKIPDINLSDYDYELPKEKIALYPLEKRDDSKLLFANIDTGELKHYIFKNLSEIVPANSLMILNNTKVIQARLIFKKPTGGKVEFLLVEPIKPSSVPIITLQEKGNCTWECIIGGKRVREGMVLESLNSNLQLKARVISRTNNKGVIEFSWTSDRTFSEVIKTAGVMPLPPYISRDTEQIDLERYQTVYAMEDGSVAAPTAGLHFTDSVLENLKNKKIDFSTIVLHVGPGTFQPMASDEISGHEMHYESINIDIDTIEKLVIALREKRNIFAVGTTCCRTLESMYWHGLKLMHTDDDNLQMNVQQWEPYQYDNLLPAEQVLNHLLSIMKKKNVKTLFGKTQLFIVPGYHFQIINGLITNFHLPKSTLILLVAAFAGKSIWRKIYETAKKNDYRFLSYGDSTILIKSIS